MKHLRFLLLLVMPAMLLTACSDEDENNDQGTPMPPAQETAVQCYVINQGNMYDNISGSLDFISASGEYHSGVFKGTNGVSLGDGPQRGIVYGTKVYIPMNGSNCVWVIDKTSCRTLKQIKTNSSEAVCAAEGYVFVSNNDGYVSRIDTTTFSVTDHVAVGPNPAQMVAVGKYVYVSISDGYNSNNQYANGFKVAKIDAESCEVTSQIAVGMNPGPLCADNQGNVYVVARGNYGDIAPAVWKIHTNDAAFYFCEGSDVACNGSTLYVLNNYTNWYANPVVSILTYAAYDVTDGSCITDKLLEGQPQPEAPTFIRVNPRDGNVYMGSNASSYDYTSPGYLYRYDADGKFVAKYNAGVAPCSIIF